MVACLGGEYEWVVTKVSFWPCFSSLLFCWRTDFFLFLSCWVFIMWVFFITVVSALFLILLSPPHDHQWQGYSSGLGSQLFAEPWWLWSFIVLYLLYSFSFFLIIAMAYFIE